MWSLKVENCREFGSEKDQIVQNEIKDLGLSKTIFNQSKYVVFNPAFLFNVIKRFYASFSMNWHDDTNTWYFTNLYYDDWYICWHSPLFIMMCTYSWCINDTLILCAIQIIVRTFGVSLAILNLCADTWLLSSYDIFPFQIKWYI